MQVRIKPIWKGEGGNLSPRNTMKRSEKFKIKYNLKKKSRVIHVYPPQPVTQTHPHFWSANDMIGKGRKG